MMPLQICMEIDYESQSNPTGKDPLFVEEHNIALSSNYFISKLKALLSYLGCVHSDYSGHSFRIGAATTCASNGIQDPMIQTLGRWKSNRLIRYIKTSDHDINAAQNDVPLTMRSIYTTCTFVYIFIGVSISYRF